MMRHPFAAVLLAAGISLAAGPLYGQDQAAQDSAAAEPVDAVVAVVNGKEIHQSDLITFIKQLPPQYQNQVQFMIPQIVDQLVNNELVSQAGRTAGLADDEEVRSRMRKIEDAIIGQTYLEHVVDEKVTDAAIDEAYKKYLEENPPERQLKARHILVKTEEEAKDIIAKLDAGADFATLAKEHSTGQSGANGGELPPFTAGEMVPAFSEAAFAMEVGTYSKEPVKTQFGYHVIKVEDSTMTTPPTKADMEQKLRGDLAQQAVAAVYEKLRKGAEIDIKLGQTEDQTPAQGEPAPAGEAPASEAPASEAPANN